MSIKPIFAPFEGQISKILVKEGFNFLFRNEFIKSKVNKKRNETPFFKN
jgi:hypothetical protein